MRTHYLKTAPKPFKAVAARIKKFEFRKEDRGFKVGDLLYLEEWAEWGGYTGRCEIRRVTYILHGPVYGVPEGFCIMSLADA